MSVLDLLDRPIAYHRVFVTLTGSVKAAVFLSQAVYWQKRATQADGWWYKSADEWQDETGLTKHEQDTARRDCEKFLKSDLRGVPATLHWKIDEEELENALIQFAGKRQTRKTQTGKQVSPKPSNINSTETTTEITQKDSSETFLEFEKRKAQHKDKGWEGREQFRDDHLIYADWWNSISGQPAKGNKSQVRSCQKAFSDWQNQGLDISSLQHSYDARLTWKKFISDPNELTKDAAAIQALPKILQARATDKAMSPLEQALYDLEQEQLKHA